MLGEESGDKKETLGGWINGKKTDISSTRLV